MIWVVAVGVAAAVLDGVVDAAVLVGVWDAPWVVDAEGEALRLAVGVAPGDAVGFVLLGLALNPPVAM